MKTISYLRTAILACLSILGITAVFAFIPDMSGEHSLAEKFADRWRRDQDETTQDEFAINPLRPVGWYNRNESGVVNHESPIASNVPRVADNNWFRDAGLPKVDLKWVEPVAGGEPEFGNMPISK